MEILKFPVSKLEINPDYEYHCGTYSPMLLKSVEEQGILSPLWIVNKNGLCIIDGHRRLRLVRRLGIVSIPAILIQEADLEEAFISVLNINLSHLSLASLEKLKVIWSVKCHFSDHAYSKVIEILDLEYIPGLLSLAAWIRKSPQWLQKYVHSANFSIKQLDKIHEYSIYEYKNWLKLGSHLSLKGAELIQILESVNEICLRDQVIPLDLWFSLNIEDLVEGHLTRHQKTGKVKEKIEEKRHPWLNEINKKMKEYIMNFPNKLNKNFEIQWDRNLEKQEIIVSCRIRNNWDIDKLTKLLSANHTRERILNLLEFMDQIPDKR